MYELRKIGFLPVLIILVTFISTNQWSAVPIGNTTTSWVVCFFAIGCILWNKSRYFRPYNSRDYRIVGFYFMWMIICVLRGCFAAEDYWDWKQLVMGILALSLPVAVYVFSIPDILQTTLRWWLKIALPAFVLFYWFIPRDVFQYYLGPVLLLGCFLPILTKKWKIILLFFLVLMMTDFGARSQLLKAIVVVLVGAVYLFNKYFPVLSVRLLNFALPLCFMVPIVLLTLGITNVFNPFDSFASGKDQYETRVSDSGENENIADDTRTFIYEEVISSAAQNRYIWLGRTPARGNDTKAFEKREAELKTPKNERHENEVCHLNVFTWIGLIGLILYSLIYLRSSYLAINQSNSIWMKLLGVFIAFRWAFGWIEDFNRFDISNITLWMIIAMGLSHEYRKMSNDEFEKNILNIFNFKYKFKRSRYRYTDWL